MSEAAPASTRHTVIDTVLGELTLTARDHDLTGIYFPGHWYLPQAQEFGRFVPAQDDELFTRAAGQLRAYLAGTRTDFELPTRTHGNPLQERVWAILRDIPRGQTTTYGAIAIALGDKALAQAVGQAVGHNPLSIVIPCHRVVGSDGGLTGFAGGLERKRFLLALEEPEEVKAARLF